jgi:acid phosphatase (class A)
MGWRFRARLALAVLVLSAGQGAASPDRIRFLEGPSALSKLSPEQQAAKVEGYLSGEEVSRIVATIPPPPPPGSAAEKADTELFQQIHRPASADRYQVARDDDAQVYVRFADQLGFTPDRETTPALVALLNRVTTDTFTVAGEAKAKTPRLRPFQVAQLKRVCGHERAPAPDPKAKGTGYPSGHASIAWTTALVLVEVAPASAQAIIGRAVSFSYSRVVCGLHFPADTEAGHLIGSAVIARAFAKPDFVRDLKCARREVEAVMRGEKAADLPACSLTAGP